MLGTVVNALSIVFCSLVGAFLVKNIPQRFEEILKKASGLAVIYIGIRGALDNENILLLILSLVFGSIIGELIDIDKWMVRLGTWAEKKLGMDGDRTSQRSFSKGFVTASILFCTGSMAIIGAMQSGLQGNHETLFAKSILDGIMSLVFSASLGIGVAFSALSVFLYQGGITFGSILIRDFLTPEMIREMSAAGSLLIAAIGFNFLGVKEIKVANMIPGIFIPLAYYLIAQAF
ncbi:MAG: DUF554 domain-containing protein [Treponema sp.]|jgi:uncharacterized membrane protein YqgA involved in biofilm formation|nr:DUF554 domain-containing protein [Treponema sp.]